MFRCSSSTGYLLLYVNIMIYTPKIEEAIQTAAILHKNQVRKGSEGYPYITHPFSVAVILSEYTNDEDIIIAGLLHDTLEDTDYTADELEKSFGLRVQSIVLGVTEQKSKDGVKIDWVKRKRKYILGLENCREESLYVSAADKIHNFNSILNSYSGDEEAFKKNFEPQDRIRFYGAIVEIITKRLGKSSAIVKRLQEVFDNYKAFLERINN